MTANNINNIISDTTKLENLKANFIDIINDFLSEVKPEKSGVIVLGCSTSEITGGVIGSASAPDIGEMIVKTLVDIFLPLDINLAVQCCEHLNRALVVERDFARKNNLEIVAAVPQAKAGGSAASAAYRLYNEPVLVELIKADAGIDIGDTFIGMHLKHVAVPVRLKVNRLGSAHITFAKTRPKYIGGIRTQYV